MPVRTCLSNILSIRFDFGVPLEDVFPPYDIHPRLKYLFNKAFESYKANGSDIEHILRYGEGMLNERLILKDKLVLSLDYHLNVEDYSPGTCFWVIRHFLGLLPLPVLPSFTKGVQFDWNILAERCKSSFKCCENDQRNILDYDIAQTLNMLPIENCILLNVIIIFLRKVSIKKVGRRHKFMRASLKALCNYYCSSLFMRPFRPGYSHVDEYHPLLLYLIIRWRNITQHCHSIGHPTFFLDSELNDIKHREGVGSKESTQTNLFANAFFKPEVITICKNIPYLVNFCNTFLKDIACQTETNLCKVNDADVNASKEKLDCFHSMNVLDDRNKDKDVYKLAYIEELEEYPELTENDDFVDNNNTLYETAPDFTFNDILDEDNKQDWDNVMKDTMETVKKIEESYIYDDYETFKKEEYNQIGKNKMGSFISRIRKQGLVYTPSKIGTKKSSTPINVSPESENSYVKYPDVCDSDNSEDNLSECHYNDEKNRDLEEIKITDHHFKNDTEKPKIPIAQKLFRSNSPASFHDGNSRQSLQDENARKKRRRQYFLTRLRIGLDFLRTITPKKSTFKMIESKVKYHRIRNGKCHTI